MPLACLGSFPLMDILRTDMPVMGGVGRSGASKGWTDFGSWCCCHFDISYLAAGKVIWVCDLETQEHGVAINVTSLRR